MSTRRTLSVAALLVAGALVAGCEQYDGNSTTTVAVPPRETFAPVAALLESHCGTLDCHGSPARNLRIYGVNGLRANGNSVTGSPDTTEEEVDRTYESLVSVDPEHLGAVFAESGRDPERWLVIRKSRGTELHTGGTPLPAGEPGDRCLTGWIAGGTDGGVCTEDDFGPKPRAGETW
ncbi:MAG TPA: hypothetical protein VHE30_13565 [Polyangiaceae bacterium]|nr:hypothetical protein [Polyangiaceae bacterium]